MVDSTSDAYSHTVQCVQTVSTYGTHPGHFVTECAVPQPCSSSKFQGSAVSSRGLADHRWTLALASLLRLQVPSLALDLAKVLDADMLGRSEIPTRAAFA